ncbi:MAG: hypothetical protein R3192_04220 [Woeseiaceae bacterium]|nr:hypothetical protein [Woeseiaceae bacterium]
MKDLTRNSGGLKSTKRYRRRSALLAASELGLVAASVAVFFVFLMLLIRIYFPQGTKLGENQMWASASDGDPEVSLEFGSASALAAQFFAAEILTIQRRVQRRGAHSLAWSDANVGDTFTENDAVQTFARSTALLRVNDQSRITIGQNSLIVFDKREADPFVSQQGSALVMINGELSGTLTSDDDAPFAFGVTLPSSDLTLVRRNQDEDVRFLVTVNDDQSTTVNLHGGSAEIVGRDGQRTRISSDQSVTIDASGTQLTVAALPDAPRSTGPRHASKVTYRNVPETVEFSWEAAANADRYHLVVARDPEFLDRVVDDDVLGTTFRHGALGPGTYYWHVRSRIGWTQSEMSDVRKLVVVRDTAPPALELEAPPPSVAAGPWRLHGKTESGAKLFVDDTPVEHDNGRFDHPIELKPGANIIVVKAMDDVGNLNYESISVNAK